VKEVVLSLTEEAAYRAGTASGLDGLIGEADVVVRYVLFLCCRRRIC
jgi:hypothetical protein